MSAIDTKVNVGIEERREFSIRDAAMSGDIAINILTSDVAPEPTSDAWSYTVKFEIVDSSGRVHDWFSGDIAAAAADTSVAGTASVSDATPAVVNGVGSVDLEGDAADWLDTEEATCTLNGTILGVTLGDKVFTVTFTA
jgi:hypothetical protein